MLISTHSLTNSLWLLCLTGINAIPHAPRFDKAVPNVYFEDNIFNNTQDAPLVDKRVAGSTMLRILPLGASITWGMGSSDNNGYREMLRNRLIAGGNPVHYVGTQYSGNMANNANEGYPGAVIDDVKGYMLSALGYQPNVVLILLGTNDCIQNVDINNAAARMGGLVDEIFKRVVGVSIIVAKLPPLGDGGWEDRCKIFNSGLDAMVTARSGKRLMSWNIHDALSLQDITSDKIHPSDSGHAKIAQEFGNAINYIGSWIQPAVNTGIPDTDNGNGANNQCEKKPGIGPFQIAVGNGVYDDGKYVHNRIERGQITSGFGKDGPGVYFADISGNGSDDYIWVGESKEMGVALKYPEGFGDFKTYDHGIQCIRRGVRFADINADGRADFICISPNGDALAWLNRKGSDDRQPVWESQGIIMNNVGYLQKNIRFGDIDGDGRDDYLVVRDNGDVYAYRNAGNAEKPAFWEDLGMIFKGNGMPDIEGIRFLDINGDGRDDLLYVYKDTGKVVSYINQRGESVGLAPAWQEAGTTHAGTAPRANITFGRVSGSPRMDYMVVGAKGSIKLYENTGKGGTQLKADGTRYCDMTGDGTDDYLWLSPEGDLNFWENIHKPPLWRPYGVIYKPGALVTDRRNVHLADLTGDRRCDYVIVNPATNEVRMLQNTGNSGSSFTFVDKGKVFNGNACNPPSKIIFADLNDDGKADVACVAKNGDTSAWLNTGPVAGQWSVQNQIKAGIGGDQANIRFADINGDGKADYLWLQKLTGKVVAWTNNGQVNGKWSWTDRGAVASGVGHRGGTIQFGNLGGLGRADYVYVEPKTNKAWVWWNRCPGSSIPAPTIPPPDVVPDPPAVTALPLPSDPANTDTPPITNKPVEEHWKEINCDAKGLETDSAETKTRWEVAEASDAWDQAVSFYQRVKNDPERENMEFVEIIADFFHATSMRKCTDVANTECHDIINCGQGNAANAAVDSPAGYLIINSIANLHKIFYDIEQALIKVLTVFQADASEVARAFASFADNKRAKIGLDVFALLFATTSTLTWTRGLKGFTDKYPRLAPNVKDGVTNIAVFGVAYAKDSMPAAAALEKESDLKTMAGNIIAAAREVNKQQSKDLFGGENIATLDKLIRDGASLRTYIKQEEIEQNFYQSLIAMSIPSAWATDSKHRTFIMTSEGLPGSGCTSDPTEYLLEPAVWEPSYSCIDGQSYWVISYSVYCRTLGSSGFCLDPDTKTRMSAARGWATIDGTAWGKLQKEDLIRSSLESWKANGNKNEWDTNLDLTKSEVVGSLAENGVRTKRIFNLPVCSAMTAFDNSGLDQNVGGVWWPCV